MKKFILLTSFFILAQNAFAQVKVLSNGNVAIQSSGTALSPISINSTGSSIFYVYGETNDRSGLHMATYGSGAGSYYGGFFSSMGSSMAFGLRGKSISTSLGMGLMGDASQGTKAIGVWGSASSVNTGAAIYGTVNGDLGSALTTGNVYAGFFNGDVKITSNLVVNGSVEGLILGESINETNGALLSQPIKNSTIRNNLSNLTVSSFQKKAAAPSYSEF